MWQSHTLPTTYKELILMPVIYKFKYIVFIPQF